MAKNKTVNLNIRVTEEEFNRLSKFAELLNVNNSAVVRKMMREFIEMYKDPRSKDSDLDTWELWNGRVVPIRLPKAYLDYTKKDAWTMAEEIRQEREDTINPQRRNLMALLAHFAGVLGGIKFNAEQEEHIKEFINNTIEDEEQKKADLLAEIEKSEREYNLTLIKNAEQIIKGNNDELKEALRNAIKSIQSE